MPGNGGGSPMMPVLGGVGGRRKTRRAPKAPGRPRFPVRENCGKFSTHRQARRPGPRSLRTNLFKQRRPLMLPFATLLAVLSVAAGPQAPGGATVDDVL